MNSELRNIIIKVTCETFEKLAFMFGEQAEKDEVEAESEDYIMATMSFSGDKQGKIGIVVPVEITPTIAHNILGIDEDEELPSGSDEDALKEVLNTMCGQFLTSIYGSEPVFNLTIPEAERVDAEKFEEILEMEKTMAIDIDDSPVLVFTSFEE